jgi:starch synthase
MSTAIHINSDACATNFPKLIGFEAMGERFLRGYITHRSVNDFLAQVQRSHKVQQFAQAVRAYDRSEPVKAVGKTSRGALAQPRLICCCGPSICEYGHPRSTFGHCVLHRCGIAYSSLSACAMDALAVPITVPTQLLNVDFYTSTAFKDSVSRHLQQLVDCLKDRLGISKITLPHLPVILLGIQTQDFNFSDPQESADRTALFVNNDTPVVLFMGGLSFHPNAHLLAMYQVLAAAFVLTAKQVALIEYGQHANADAAGRAYRSVRVVTLDCRKAEYRQTARAGANVFYSLSDKIQEAFGILPIEAMVAGLSVSVLDWDGYKETVPDRIAGYRVPTLMPQPGLGGDSAHRHALDVGTYDMNCGHTCSLVAVNVLAAAAAFEKLCNIPELRRQTGEAGKKRAQQVYDWKNVIAQYEALWADQAKLRIVGSKVLKQLAHPWLARMDPFHAFPVISPNCSMRKRFWHWWIPMPQLPSNVRWLTARGPWRTLPRSSCPPSPRSRHYCTPQPKFKPPKVLSSVPHKSTKPLCPGRWRDF